MSWAEEELAKAVKVLAGTAAIPLRVAADITADIAGEIVESLQSYVPKPSRLRNIMAKTNLQRYLRTIKKDYDVVLTEENYGDIILEEFKNWRCKRAI